MVVSLLLIIQRDEHTSPLVLCKHIYFEANPIGKIDYKAILYKDVFFFDEKYHNKNLLQNFIVKHHKI